MSESLLLSKGMKTAPLLNKNTGIVLRNISESYEMIVLRLRAVRRRLLKLSTLAIAGTTRMHEIVL